MSYSDHGKVDELIRNVDRLAEDIKRWQYKQEKVPSISIEALKDRVDAMWSKLDNLSSRVTTYDKIKKAASQPSTEATDMHILEHLTFRVSQLETWVAQIDDRFKKDVSIARKQFVISLTTLVAVAAFIGITIWFQLGSW
jgi:predicted patatin/cPLA2 family phospholipase